MKQLILSVLVAMLPIATSAQTIISRTTEVAKYAGDFLEKVELADNSTHYNLWLHSGDKVISSVRLTFNTVDDVVKCLSYLYQFDKGDGYLIDLHTVNGNTAFSSGKTYLIKGHEQLAEVLVYKFTIGKLLNALGKSVYTDGKPRNTTADDIYDKGKSLF